jgi:hypothetical protein
MNPSRTQAILETLWSMPREDVFAVLDAARNPRIHPMILECGMRYACLYAGAIPVELAKVAPYVVRLSPTHAATLELLEAGWGDSWGVFACTAADVETVRRHLRRFLRVQREDGRTMIFRYYDPRVLRVYLPTCTASELATFFGPLARFVVEDADASRALAFSQTDGAFGMSKFALDGGDSRAVAVPAPASAHAV